VTALHDPPGAQVPQIGELPPLDADDGLTLVCRQVRMVTHDVRTFLFQPETAGHLPYRPGQFMTFDFTVDGRPVNRCYTLSSSPTRPHLLSITVKRTPGGVVSNWLHDNLRPGDKVRARGPYGLFTMEDHPAEKYLLLSGGSGATPFMSMARALHDTASHVDVVYLHSARTPHDVLFRDELRTIAQDLPGFTAAHVCEDDAASEPWHGYRGRLSASLLWSAVPDIQERAVLSCGPEGYLTAVRELLVELGCDPARCYEEVFATEPSAAARAGAPLADTEPQPEAGTGFSVKFALSGVETVCPPDTTLLEAAEAAGLGVPTSCRQGLCGTCKTTLVSGHVDMRHGGGIRDREIARGGVLPCCSTPLSDIVINL
jgi:ferredoxin-NADP reductase